MESDDRVTTVVKHLDDALAELDKLEGMFGMYKTQLNVSVGGLWRATAFD